MTTETTPDITPDTSADSSFAQPLFDLKKALEALPSSSRLSNADTDAIYALAHQMVVQGRYETAYGYFSLLVLYKPTNVSYLKGLALCYRMLERYDQALHVYSFLGAIDPQEVEHSMAIVECLLLKRDITEARNTIALILQFCAENPVPEKSSARAQALHELLDPAAQGASTANT